MPLTAVNYDVLSLHFIVVEMFQKTINYNPFLTIFSFANMIVWLIDGLDHGWKQWSSVFLFHGSQFYMVNNMLRSCLFSFSWQSRIKCDIWDDNRFVLMPYQICPSVCLSVWLTCDLWPHLSTDQNNLGVVWKPQNSSFRKVSLVKIGRSQLLKFGVSIHSRHNERTSLLVTPGDWKCIQIYLYVCSIASCH